MSFDILQNCAAYDESTPTGYAASYVPTLHAIRHDLESLGWVAEYALFRRAYRVVAQLPRQDARRKKFEETFAMEFGTAASPSSLARQRQFTAAYPRGYFSPLQEVREESDPSLANLIAALMTLIRKQHPREVNSQDMEVQPPGDKVVQPRFVTCARFEYVMRKVAERENIKL